MRQPDGDSMTRNRSYRVSPRRCLVAGLAILAALVAAKSIVQAADYPTRPVTIIVPTGPGGSYDVVARLVAEQLSNRLGQGVVVENRTGAGTIVGTQSAINSQPDGYTLLAGGLSNIVFNANLYRKAPYDALTQLVPVAIVYKLAYVLVGSNALPFSSVGDLIAAAKAKPDALNLATAGVGTGQQLTAVAFMKATDTKLLEVPYKGAAAVYPDLIAGRVDLFFDSVTAALPYVKAGTVKGLAILADQRMSDAPNVPTMDESGVKGLNVDSWIGLFAPAGTPRPVVEKLQKEIAATAPELKSKFVAVGGDYLQVPPDKLNAFVKAEFDKWSKLIKDAGITLE
jgi:tripartite-type tricarboxylate transporter receptor subunit TctC